MMHANVWSLYAVAQEQRKDLLRRAAEERSLQAQGPGARSSLLRRLRAAAQAFMRPEVVEQTSAPALRYGWK